MKAVNLIPSDGPRRGFSTGAQPRARATPCSALLAVAVGFVTLYVLTNNTISKRKTQLASLQAQVQQEHAAATQLANYVRFAKLGRSPGQDSARDRHNPVRLA